MSKMWLIEHKVFAYESYVKNNESIIAVQREFRRHFNLTRHQSVPKRDTILNWVRSLRTDGTLHKKKPPGAPRTVRTPDNVERLREAILRNPKLSARKHSAALGISIRSTRRILHEELNWDPTESKSQKKKPPEAPTTVKTPDNAEHVQEAETPVISAPPCT